ncbi:unnamed protein product [Urochloa decumbens]|uniref:SWIM-type domain-containing protein n=1 Tax=Urochloa decumbens TaxID=240449 RepID=A0ABC8WR34_9POAL
MDGGDSSPVMTESERRAYRYGHQAAPRLRGMRQSWSNDSLAGYGGSRAACVCAPTTHPGSFRCKHHRHAAAAKHDEAQQETAPGGADRADRSST